MVPFNLEVLAKFGLCSNCSQKSDECSLARAHKISAAALMLRFSLKCTWNARSIICIFEAKLTPETMIPFWQNWEKLGKHARAVNVSAGIG